MFAHNALFIASQVWRRNGGINAVKNLIAGNDITWNTLMTAIVIILVQIIIQGNFYIKEPSIDWES